MGGSLESPKGKDRNNRMIPIEDLTLSELRTRYFMLHGWARAALTIHSIHERQEFLVKRRGNRHGIAVHSDYNALLYQVLEFRLWRVHYALDCYGLRGYTAIRPEGAYKATKSELAEMNRESFAAIRKRGHSAARALKEAGLYPCNTCGGEGYILEGDESYPCPHCEIKGIVQLETLAQRKPFL